MQLQTHASPCRARWLTWRLALIALSLCGFPIAGTAQAPTITVNEAWVRPAAQSVGVSAFYAVVNNTGDKPDRLVSAETPAARATTLHHTMEMHGGAMRIEEMPEGIVIPAHGKIVLQGEDRHVMLIGLTRSIEPGQMIELKLKFERAGTITVMARAENRTPALPGGH